MMPANDELQKIIIEVQGKLHPIQMAGFYAEPILLFNERYYDDLKTRVNAELEGLKMGTPMNVFTIYGYSVIFDAGIKKYKILFEFPNKA